ncbi:MAG: flagellar biosynthetic protein FliR [Acidobacteriota bacterium]
MNPTGPAAGWLEPLFADLGPALGLDPALGPEAALRLFLLALARWLPVVVLSPVLGGKLVPAAPKMALATLFAVVTLPHLGATVAAPGIAGAAAGAVAVPAGLGFWTLLLKEAFVGLVLGFGSSLIFWGADIAGRFLDNVRGTTTANLMIPHERVQSSLLGDFYFQLFVVLYVAAGGHLVLLGAVFDSYRLVPGLSVGLGASVATSFIAATGGLLSVAVRLVAPALVVLIAMDVMLGVANRFAPQLNVFFLSMSLKSSVGALVAALGLYVVLAASGDLFRDHHRWLADTTSRLAPDAVLPSSPSIHPRTL